MFHRSYYFVQELKAIALLLKVVQKVWVSNSQPAKRAITTYNSLLTPDWHD